LGDLEAVAFLRARLWPEASRDEHREEVRAILAGLPRSTLPLVIFVAEDADRVIGFVEVGLRSHADGCDPTRPCGFIEGWYVAAEHRRRGVGRLLMDRAEAWAREQGSTELASDTEIQNQISQHAHAALGFEVVDRCVNFRKKI
jgi:aminoglycoside 6'-N-acetyltransferase I